MPRILRWHRVIARTSCRAKEAPGLAVGFVDRHRPTATTELVSSRQSSDAGTVDDNRAARRGCHAETNWFSVRVVDCAPKVPGELRGVESAVTTNGS